MEKRKKEKEDMLLEGISLIILTNHQRGVGEGEMVGKRFWAKFLSFLYVNCPHSVKKHPQFVIFSGFVDSIQPHAISYHLYPFF